MIAFRTWYGHFKYQVMTFGLSNAPATFQVYVKKILDENLDIFIIVYLNDILIYIEDPVRQHVEAVRWVLDKLRKYLLFANLKKYCFHQDEVYFLGYVVSSKDISIEAERIEEVKEWPEPKSVQDIHVFLGFANFYWRFIQDFNRIAALLISMLKTTNKPPPAGTTASGQSLVETMTVSQPLGKMTATVRLIDLVVMVWSTLRSQENRKAKNRLSLENCLIQENLKVKNWKNHQKVGIHLISMLKIPGQAS